jgi:dipeptidyl aminopeptidase/acylaminoacyl peptidase
MVRMCLPLLAATVLLGNVSVSRAGLPPLIPRKVLFGNPVKTAPALSPDGKRLAYLAPDKRDVLQVWVKTLGENDDRAVTNDRFRGIRLFQWTYAPNTILFLQDNNGDENFHIFSVDLTENVIRDLTPFQGIRAQVVAVHRDFPNELLAALNLKNRQVLDVYRIDLNTGAVVLDTKNPGDVLSWEVDAKFRVRGAQASLHDGGTEVRYRKDEKSPWQRVVRWGPDDADGRILDFTADGRAMYLLSSSGRDTLALVKHDLESGKEEVIAADPRADASAVVIHPDSHRLQAVAFNYERVHWKALDDSFAEDLHALEKGHPGEPTIVSRDHSLNTWVVGYSADVEPTEFFLYDRKAKKLKPLFKAQPALSRYRLAHMKPVVIKSRDGLDLVSYLTLPVGVEPKGLPLVLLVHGGPWSRDTWGYNSWTQWLANRGYAVLSVNYRGSTGFGKKFLHAGDREWAGKMHDDLIDAVHWAIKEGYADPKQVAIFGGSYGGYAALVGATFTPDVFACAVDIVGPSNLVTLLSSIPPYWEPMRRMFATRVGDVEKEEEFLRSRSPLFKADRIRIPVLIAQGLNDPRVKVAESEQIVEAIKKAGKPVEYLLFPDEGHGFVRPENRLRFAAFAEVFLARYLHGRVEPLVKP